MRSNRLSTFGWGTLLVVLLALVAFRVAQRWTAWQQAEARRQQVATQYAAVVATATELAREATAVIQPEVLQATARAEGEMVGEGEVLVRPYPVPGAPLAEAEPHRTPMPTPTPTPTPSPWQVWWALFFASP